MSIKHSKQFILSSLAISSLLLSACGRDNDLPNDVSNSLQSTLSNATSNASNDDQIKDAIPKILLGLEEIKQEIKGLRSSGISPISSSKPGTKPTTGTKPSTGTKPTTGTKPATTTPTKPSTGTSTPAAASATETLKTILKDISSKPFVDASVEKTEKHLTEGRVTQVKLNMFSKSPNLVKVEINFSTSGASGAKLIYNSGEGAKAKVRPGGAMSFMTTELPKTDDRLTSTNGYTLDDIDLVGLSRRMMNGYTAELVGKSQVNGTELHILKVKSTGENTMDSRVDYEYIGFEPDTNKIRLWEMYTADSKEPFFRMALTKLEYPATLSDSVFKL